jgi:hypothetical protein
MSHDNIIHFPKVKRPVENNIQIYIDYDEPYFDEPEFLVIERLEGNSVDFETNCETPEDLKKLINEILEDKYLGDDDYILITSNNDDYQIEYSLDSPEVEEAIMRIQEILECL